MSNYATKKLVEAYQLDNSDVLKILITKDKRKRRDKITNTEISLSRSPVNLKKRKTVVKG